MRSGTSRSCTNQMNPTGCKDMRRSTPESKQPMFVIATVAGRKCVVASPRMTDEDWTQLWLVVNRGARMCKKKTKNQSIGELVCQT